MSRRAKRKCLMHKCSHRRNTPLPKLSLFQATWSAWYLAEKKNLGTPHTRPCQVIKRKGHVWGWWDWYSTLEVQAHTKKNALYKREVMSSMGLASVDDNSRQIVVHWLYTNSRQARNKLKNSFILFLLELEEQHFFLYFSMCTRIWEFSLFFGI